MGANAGESNYPHCTDCPYRSISTGLVKGEGSPDASIMFVGEAPGPKELTQRRPFIGPSGAELTKWITAMGLARGSVYITNVVKCLPNHKTPGPDQARECMERYFWDEVAKVKPDYVVAVGKVAATALGVPMARKMGVANGYILQKDGYRVIAIRHPAYCLREQWVDNGGVGRWEALADLGKLKAEMRGKVEVESPPADLTPFNVLLEDLPQVAEVAVDIETSGLDRFTSNTVLIGYSWRRPDGSIAMASHRLCGADSIVLTSPDVRKIFHNINFDVGVLHHADGVTCTPPYGDTELGHNILYSDLPKGLEYIARTYLNIEPWKWTQHQAGGEKLYNAIDCFVTLRAWEEMEKAGGEFDREGVRDVADRSFNVLPLTLEAAQIGIRVDEPRINALKGMLTVELADMGAELDHLAEVEGAVGVNWNSSTQVRNLLYKTLELPKKFKGGGGNRKLTADASAMEELAHLHPIPKLLRRRNLFSKISSTFLVTDNIHNGRIYPQFPMDKTVTGRMSSTSPNFQNLPRIGPVRGVYLPDSPDHYLLQADFSQIEMRYAAAVSGDPTLCEAYEKGWDVHTVIAQRAFERETISKNERSDAKRIVYGIIYGTGARALAKIHGWEVPYAKEFLEKFEAEFPVFFQWRAATLREAKATGKLTTPWGRRRFFRGRNFAPKAFNYFPQSGAADVLIDGVEKVAKDAPWRQMLWVHDSFILSVPKREIADAKVVLAEALAECALGFATPIDIDYGPRWGDWVGEE